MPAPDAGDAGEAGAAGAAGDAGRAGAGRRWRLVALLVLWLPLAACALARNAPTPDGLTAATVQGAPFRHRVYANAALLRARDAAGGAVTVHLYLDGDGSPWVRGGVSADPGPRSWLVRRLLQQDAAPALYLGRPCQLTLPDDGACTPNDWTFGRYSSRVVASLAAAADAALPPGARVVLVGHSGGGTLAVLLAPRLRGVVGVVTLAGNLDVAAWTRLHGYAPLYDSLDPALQLPLPPRIRQLHLVAANDTEVPPGLTRAALGRSGGATLRVIDDADHACCWLRAWRGVLREIAAW